MPAPSPGDSEPRTAKLFARAGTIHESSARVLRQTGHPGAARHAERLAAAARQRVAESASVARMYALARKLRSISTRQQLVEDALDGAIAFLDADRGNIQLADSQTKKLKIVAQRGFTRGFLEHFDAVDEDHAACGRAAKARAQLVIVDVNEDPDFEPHRAIAAAAGFRAVQSTPLIDHTGRLHGVLSTHFDKPHRPRADQLRLTQTYARLLADALAPPVDARPLPRPTRTTAWPSGRSPRQAAG
jgi:GAF domain